jgi:hypothetical protein
MAISFWQFMDDEKIKAKVVPWDNLTKTGITIIDPVEENDYLLGWGDNRAFRYCHHFTNEEIQRYVDGSGLKLVENYSADGKNNNLNRYVVLKK